MFKDCFHVQDCDSFWLRFDADIDSKNITLNSINQTVWELIDLDLTVYKDIVYWSELIKY